MGYKVFVSYKYADDNVRMINNSNNSNDYYSLFLSLLLNPTTARNYVDILEEKLGKSNIYKGEHDDENLSHLSEGEIWNKLKDRIYDSTITIVLITPNMIDKWKTETNQWIPWEISYSLKEITRNDRTSKTNGIIAVVIPDKNSSYSYAIDDFWGINNDSLFPIIKKNMNNLKALYKLYDFKEKSYIDIVKWDIFIKNMNFYLDKAKKKSDNVEMYELSKLTSDTYNN